MIHSAEISLRLQQQLSQDSGTLCLSVQHTGLSSEIDFPPERQIESHMKYNRKNKKAPVSTSCPPPMPHSQYTSHLLSSRALVPFCPSPSSLVSKWSGVFKPKLRSAARYSVPIATSQTVLWLHYNPTVIKSKWNRDDKDAIFSLGLWERVWALPFHSVLFSLCITFQSAQSCSGFFHYFGPLFWTNIVVMSCKKRRLAWSNDTVWLKRFHTQTHQTQHILWNPTLLLELNHVSYWHHGKLWDLWEYNLSKCLLLWMVHVVSDGKRIMKVDIFWC